MRAVAAFPADRTLRVIEAPEPVLASDEDVLVRILEVGICGTDREIGRFEYGTPPPGEDHLVVGHESLGEVVAVGSSVQTLRRGDLAVLMVRRPCDRPECEACRAGRSDFCQTGDYTERGIKMRHGYLAERVVDRERYAIRVPPELREVGVLVEPLTIAEKALAELADVERRLPWLRAATRGPGARRQRAVVLGAGPVGLLATLALQVRGFETWVYSRGDRASPKARWAESVGARYVSSRDVDPETLAARIRGVDLAFEATGAAEFSFRAMVLLGANGTFVFTGVPGRRGPITLPAGQIMREMVLRNQVLYGVVNAGREAFASAIDDLREFDRRWHEQLSGLITGRHALAQAPDVISRPTAGLKDVVEVAGR